MPEKKEPGQITYYASHPAGTWAVLGPEEKAYYERVEAAVLAAHKPERAAGVWVCLDSEPDFILFAHVVRVSKFDSAWELFTVEDNTGLEISEADARRVVEALGGTWPEEANG